MTAAPAGRPWRLPAVAALVVAAVGCGSGPAGRSAGPPGGVTRLVPLAASSFSAVTVTATATGRTQDLPAADAARLAPLLAARTFAQHQPLAQYGLDRPVAEVAFVRAGAATERLFVGATDFDATGYYVDRAGDPAVYLVLTTELAPALGLVGIVTPTQR
jgi:hypothetical protein